MKNLVVPELLSVFDPKVNRSASTVVGYEEITQRKSMTDLDSEQNSKIGRWDYDQQLLYLEFVQNNKAYLENKECRRSAKVFKVMATIIKTRGPDQCRSHHQKMQKKYDTVENILVNCKKGLPRLKKRKVLKIQKATVQHYQIKIQNIPEPLQKSDEQGQQFLANEEEELNPFKLTNDIESPEIYLDFKNQEMNLFNIYDQSFQMLF